MTGEPAVQSATTSKGAAECRFDLLVRRDSNM